MSDIDRYDYAFDLEGDAWAARLLRRVPDGGSVLELGPGPGAMTQVLRARGQAVTVVENDPAALQALQPLGVQVVEADLDGRVWLDALEGRRFDTILACDVLEHLRQPEQVLKALAGLLQPMGSVIISLPNIAYAGVAAALRVGMFDYADKGLLDRTHLRFFTRRSIEQLLMDCGWVPVAWEANRVPVAQSEFAWYWESIPDAWRQHLLTGWADFDVYQWMVVAAPARDSRDWAAMQVRTEANQLRTQLQALQVTHAAEHASLLEHQKAFAEARQLIAQFEQELEQLRQQVRLLATDKAALEQVCSNTQATLAGRTWRARLDRLLGRGLV
ncbi:MULTISPECIES: bifunctional 2-polyprenyl-6-hydroxyphenol methylase/3-demethylubiquinol 3-O-methyltransferase UbiG [unclassified Simplicispira]|uniref:class I SAM-dependent methyltransferase n=1 Tax=unclassified Simplicispira TaxID=2630407 RepID=UPI000D5D5852|nr:MULTISPECIES: class I SAM-dependent methyltransferase [unclassified Simplicispira]PVY58132.1 methyltransferase family protein [Simplicispira sp. 125]REG15497.1 methyltransferase family protein [Simplicispira sp. 110]